MQKFFKFKRYLAGGFLPLLAIFYSLNIVAEPSPVVTQLDIQQQNKSDRQSAYEGMLDYAISTFRIAGQTWPLEPAKDALKNKVPFDQTTADILTMSVENLAATGVSRFHRELPEQYAVWAEVCNLMDEAEKAGLYTPPSNVRAYLTDWRLNQAIKAEIDAAPWVQGPANVIVDPNMDLVYIPSGFRFLPKEMHVALEKRLRLLRGDETERHGLPVEYDTQLNAGWVMPSHSQAWSAIIKVYYGGKTSIDEALQSDEALLEKIKVRLQSKIENEGSYAHHAVRWIMPPEKNRENHTVRWAFTNGRIDEPLGIEATYLKLGAKMFVEVDYQDLSAAEYLSTAAQGIEGQDPENYKADNVFKRADMALKPLFDSLNLEVNDPFIESSNTPRMSPTPVSYFITRVSNETEESVDRPEPDEAKLDTNTDDQSLINQISEALFLVFILLVLFFMLRSNNTKRL